MQATRRKYLVFLGLVFGGVGVVGLWDAVFVHPSCRWVLYDVRVCGTNWVRALPSLLVGTLGLALLAVRWVPLRRIRR